MAVSVANYHLIGDRSQLTILRNITGCLVIMCLILYSTVLYDYYTRPSIEDWMEDIKTQTQKLTHDSEPTIEAKSETLVGCEILMSGHNLIYSDGDILTRETTRVEWVPRSDGSRQLELRTGCKLKRYTAHEARKCFATHHVAMIGDSVSRYQFLSLTYFLERGQWPARFRKATRGYPCRYIDTETGNASCSELPSITSEEDFADEFGAAHGVGWHHYHSAIGGSTDGGPYHGRMECKCNRHEKDGSKADNMQFVSRQPHEGAMKGLPRFKVTYLSEYGWGNTPGNLTGWNFTGCANSGTCRWPVETADKLLATPVDWNTSLADGLENRDNNSALYRIAPDVDIAIYNRGIWGTLERSLAKRVYRGLFEWSKGEKGRCVFKGTTANHKGHVDQSWHILEAKKAGCGVLDYAHVTKEFEKLPWLVENMKSPPHQSGGEVYNMREHESVYSDSVHFQPWVYEELNQLLFNFLCNRNGPEGPPWGA